MRKDKSSAAAEPGPERFLDLARVPVGLRLGSYRSEILYWGYFAAKWWRNYLHTHSFYEFCYAYAGRGHYTVRGRELPVAAGDLFVARPGEQHEIISSRKQPLGIYFWAYTLVRDTDKRAVGRDQTIDALLQSFMSSTRAVIGESSHIQRTIELLTQEIAHQAPGYTRAIEALTLKLLLDCARAAADGPLTAEQLVQRHANPSDAVVQTAVQYLQDNLSRPISVRDVAAQVHLSERQLSRVFRKATGTSILQCLTRMRIDTASQLLLDREMPIKQIARAVGYPDSHYFTTTFGRHTGLTPAAFRRAGGTRLIKP